MKVKDVLPNSIRRTIRRSISLAKRAGMSARSLVARVIRYSVRLIEKVAPSLSRKIKMSGWVWQPTHSHEHLDAFYDAVDPFRFGTNPYESGKYEHTMSLLSGRSYDTALEIGASEGIFTQIVAPLCKSLVAIDVAKAAVERAKVRLADIDHVSFRQASIPNEYPEGTFDLIIASDILYYFPKDVLVDITRQISDKLNPDGIFFALHYLGDFGQPISGGEVHYLLKSHSGLAVTHDETVADVGPKKAGYAVTIFKKSE